MKSIKNGMNISEIEISNISQHGFWIYYMEKEYFVPFSEFPWFKDCKLSTILNYEADERGNFFWPDIDVDLNIDILNNPDNYPLISK